MDPLLYGHAPDERIVAAAQLNDQTIRLYSRTDGKVLQRDAEFFPFFFLTDPSLLDGFEGHTWQKELAGANPFRLLVAFSRWSEMWNGVHHVLQTYNRFALRKAATFHDVDSLFIRPEPVRQYLLQSGITLFKGMAFEELLRVQVDLLVRPKAPSRSAESGLLVIAASASDGSELLLDRTELEEPELLRQFAAWIQERDPDIVEGHFLFDRILPALQMRFESAEVPALLGRDGRPLRQSSVRGWYGPGESERMQFELFGRQLIDTAHLAEQFFSASHWSESPSLAAVSGSLLPPRTDQVPALDTLLREWDRNPKAVAAQMRARVKLVQEVSARLLPPLVAQSRLCPFNLGYLAQVGLPARTESLMLRAYVRAKQSLPHPPVGSPAAPPFADAYRLGLFHNVVEAELLTLPASHIAAQNIAPASDQLRAYPQIAGQLAAIAFDADHPDAAGARELASGLHAYLANGRALFHDSAEADRLGKFIQDSVAAVIQRLDRHNAKVLHADSERLYIVVPDNVIGPANAAAFLQRAASPEEDGCRLSYVATFQSMLCHRRRSFALLDERTTAHVIGTALLPRSSERFIRRFLLRSIECLLTADVARLHHTYASFRTVIANHQWTVGDFCRVETVREELEEYIRSVDGGTRTPSPAIEAARRAGTYVRPGTRVAYYVTGTHHDVRLSDVCRVAEEWDPNLPNENTAYYQQRLNDAAGRLQEFFEPKDFETIFALDDLFGFTDRGIDLIQRSLEPAGGVPAEAEKEPADGLGIWLAEEDENTP